MACIDIRIPPAYPHATSVPGDVFVFIVGMGIRIASDILDHRSQIVAFGIHFFDDRTKYRFANKMLLWVTEQFFAIPVDRNDVAVNIPAQKDAVCLINQLSVQTRFSLTVALYGKNQGIPLPLSGTM